MVTLTFSPCPNDTFVFHAWVHGLIDGAPPVDVSYHDVDVANGMAERGERDVIKVSYAALPWLLRDYALLPCGGAVGRGCGPLVLTTGREDLLGATVAVPGERTTAYLLFRLWAADHGIGAVEVVPFEQIMPAVRDGRYDAGLVIHEARFTYPAYGLDLCPGPRCVVGDDDRPPCSAGSDRGAPIAGHCCHRHRHSHVGRARLG